MKTIKCPKCNHKQSREWQFCHRCLHNLYPNVSLNIISRPSWTSIRGDESAKDPQGETRKVEAMIEEREKEMRTSTKARRWEQGRKQEIMNYKPTWVKKGRKAADLPK